MRKEIEQLANQRLNLSDIIAMKDSDLRFWPYWFIVLCFAHIDELQERVTALEES